jgi:hypothetical protein
MACAIRPSNVRVYQFHHFRKLIESVCRYGFFVLGFAFASAGFSPFF